MGKPQPKSTTKAEPSSSKSTSKSTPKSAPVTAKSPAPSKSRKVKKGSADATTATAQATTGTKTAKNDEKKVKEIVLKPGAEFVLTEIRKMEGLSYYHGMVTRDSIEKKLTRSGDFLLRLTDNRVNEFEFILSCFNKKKIHAHLTIHGDWQTKLWHLGLIEKNKFNAVTELINYYRSNPIGTDFYLVRAITKPKHFITHDKIKYNVREDLLGSGNFSDVYKAKMELSDGSYVKVALKNSKLITELWDPDSRTPEAVRSKSDMLREAETMSQMRHPHITAMFGIAAERLPIFIVLEYCVGGNLEGFIRKNGDYIELPERLLYMNDIANGLKYIHSMSITHRDLAVRNVLIDCNGFLKISDFGMGLRVKQNVGKISNSGLPMRWMAPELMISVYQFSPASDMWSFGVLCWEIFTNGARPLDEIDDKKLREHIKAGNHPKIPDYVDKITKDLMEQLFTLEANQRINADTFLQTHRKNLKENFTIEYGKLGLRKQKHVIRTQFEPPSDYIPPVILVDYAGNESDWVNAPKEILPWENNKEEEY